MMAHTSKSARARSGRRALTVLVAVLGCQLTAPPAQAHVELVASSPAAGDAVLLSTTTVVLAFAEDLAPESVDVVVRDEQSSDVVVEEPVVSGRSVEVAVDLVRPGRHTVAYRVVGIDGHPLTGEYAFTARPPGRDIARGEPAAAGGETGRPYPPPSTGTALALSTGGEAPDPGTPWLPWLLATGSLVGLVLMVRGLADRRPPPSR